MANERARQLRSNSTNAEQKLWSFLRSLKKQGFHFRRQVPIDHLIVDFACYAVRLVIEVDGGQHNTASGQWVDARRDHYLRRQQFKVLRFWNNEVLSNLEGVAYEIQRSLNLITPTPIPSPQGGGEYHALPEELDSIDRGLKAAREGRLATDKQVEPVFARYRR